MRVSLPQTFQFTLTMLRSVIMSGKGKLTILEIILIGISASMTIFNSKMMNASRISVIIRLTVQEYVKQMIGKNTRYSRRAVALS